MAKNGNSCPTAPFAALPLVLALAGPGCTSLPAPDTLRSDPKSVVFQCAGRRVPARFHDDYVDLLLDGRVYRLPRAVSASGARFATSDGPGQMLFWNKGDAARLEIGDIVVPDCHVVAEN